MVHSVKKRQRFDVHTRDFDNIVWTYVLNGQSEQVGDVLLEKGMDTSTRRSICTSTEKTGLFALIFLICLLILGKGFGCLIFRNDDGVINPLLNFDGDVSDCASDREHKHTVVLEIGTVFPFARHLNKRSGHVELTLKVELRSWEAKQFALVRNHHSWGARPHLDRKLLGGRWRLRGRQLRLRHDGVCTRCLHGCLQTSIK
mmetsp:Transcript_4869/g.9416  ORF Transcript_4869/g.9416 Transcript_4869/m.9416 type:complete len:201 (+) Transcript_4869:1732-2334(+)